LDFQARRGPAFLKTLDRFLNITTILIEINVGVYKLFVQIVFGFEWGKENDECRMMN
jgi:hypothetical protein